jgi:hypothetical protein
MADELLLVAAAAFLTCGVIQILPGSGSGQTRAVRAAMFTMFSLALALDTPVIYASFDNVTRISNLADLISHLAGLIGILLLSHILSTALDPEQKDRLSFEIPLILGTMITATILFFNVHAPVDDSSFSAHYRNQYAAKAYWTLPALIAGWCLLKLARAVVRHARGIHRRDVALGLTIAAAGSTAFGGAYIVLKLVELYAPALEPLSDQEMTAILLAPGMTLLAAGLLIPLSARSAGRAYDNLRTRRYLIGLRPLQAQLHDAGALDASRHLFKPAPLFADALGRVTVEHLIRRVVETQDAVLTVSTRVLEADTAEAEITAPPSRQPVCPGLTLDIQSARLLATLAAEPSRRTAPVGPLGRRSLDVYAEARDLIDLRRSWADATERISNDSA